MYRIYEDVYQTTRLRMIATETRRSFERQQSLYEVGRKLVDGKWVRKDPKKRETLTNAPPGFSLHAYGLATDSAWAGNDPYLENIPKDLSLARWRTYGALARAHGCVWGGDWNGNGVQDANDFDRPHCELAYGFRLEQLLELHGQGGLHAVWAAIDLKRGVRVGEGWENLTFP